MRKSNEERIDELQADTVSNIETLAGRLKTELANVMNALVSNTQLNADIADLKAELARTQKDLDEARVLNGELAKTNDSLEADILVSNTRLEVATKRISRQGATRIPVADKPTVGPVDPKNVVGSMELTTVTEQQIASLLASGHRVMVAASVKADISGLHNVAFVPVPVAVPVELKVKFEKTTEELADLVLEELKRQNRSISDGVERVKLNVFELMQIVEREATEARLRFHRVQTSHASGEADGIEMVLSKLKEKQNGFTSR